MFCEKCKKDEEWRKRYGMLNGCGGYGQENRCPQLQRVGCCKPDFCLAKGRDVDGSDCEKCEIWPT